MGRIAGALLNDGVTLGVSLHVVWVPSLQRNGANYVGEDFMLATAADIVKIPLPGCFRSRYYGRT